MATYTIKAGDTLGALAKKFGTDVGTLAKMNKIADPNKISAGATLNYGAPANASATTGMPSAPITAAFSPTSMTAHTTPMMAGVTPIKPAPMLSGTQSSALTSPAAKQFIQNQAQTGGTPSVGTANRNSMSASWMPEASGVGTAAGNGSGAGNGTGTGVATNTNNAYSKTTATNTGYTAPTTADTGNMGVGTPTGAYASPDRQAYIDAYKKYIEAQTNNADVQSAKQAYQDYLAEQAKSIAGLEGRGLGVPISLVRGTQEKLLKQTQPELARLQGNVDIAQKGMENIVGGAKSGVDLQKNLLDFGQQDVTNKYAAEKAAREANPAFSLNEGDVRYAYDPKSNTYKIVGKGAPKTFPPKSTTETTAQKTAAIRSFMSSQGFKDMTPEQKKDYILYNGGNPVDYNILY